MDKLNRRSLANGHPNRPTKFESYILSYRFHGDSALRWRGPVMRDLSGFNLGLSVAGKIVEVSSPWRPNSLFPSNLLDDLA
jgi:hypothetical protein